MWTKCDWCHETPEEGARYPKIGVTASCELLRECLELNLGPLQKQHLFSTAELFPQSKDYLCTCVCTAELSPQSKDYVCPFVWGVELSPQPKDYLCTCVCTIELSPSRSVFVNVCAQLSYLPNPRTIFAPICKELISLPSPRNIFVHMCEELSYLYTQPKDYFCSYVCKNMKEVYLRNRGMSRE